MIPKRAGSGVRTEASVSRVEDALMAQAPRPLRPTRPRAAHAPTQLHARDRSPHFVVTGQMIGVRPPFPSPFHPPPLPPPLAPQSSPSFLSPSLWRPPPALASGRRLSAEGCPAPSASTAAAAAAPARLLSGSAGGCPGPSTCALRSRARGV
ncbi:uncharacterized protein LOC114116216, partial [Ovis aries]|uniref:uncharacterized protein LOC114116216 n=1 Tax=Ovis aries TaxID=9940 RepID=UPI00072F73C2